MTTKRGRILRDTHAGPGLVTVDGKQYSFTLEAMWVSEVPPRAGMVVEVSFGAEGDPVTLRAVPENQIAREQAQQALAGARTHGTALAGKLRGRFGAPLIIAMAVLIVGWFFLECVNFGGPRLSLTFWQLLGLAGDANAIPAMFERETMPGSGVYGLFALVALAGPLLRFVWPDRRAALGGVLPLLLMLVVALEVRTGIRSSFERAAGIFDRLNANVDAWPNFLKHLDVSFGMGAFLSLGACLFLAWMAVRQFLVSDHVQTGQELQGMQVAAQERY